MQTIERICDVDAKKLCQVKLSNADKLCKLNDLTARGLCTQNVKQRVYTSLHPRETGKILQEFLVLYPFLRCNSYTDPELSTSFSPFACEQALQCSF